MRDEERRYDEASQLCRAADDLKDRVESLRNRVEDGPGGDRAWNRDDLELARDAAAEAVEHLRRYREKLVGGDPDELGAPPRRADGATEEVGTG